MRKQRPKSDWDIIATDTAVRLQSGRYVEKDKPKIERKQNAERK